jgi:hypothetical protein
MAPSHGWQGGGIAHGAPAYFRSLYLANVHVVRFIVKMSDILSLLVFMHKMFGGSLGFGKQ